MSMSKYCSYVADKLKEAKPVAAPSKAWVCGRSLAGTEGSNPAEGMDVCLLYLLYVVRSGYSLVHRSTVECGVSECDLETTTMRRSRPTGAVKP